VKPLASLSIAALVVLLGALLGASDAWAHDGGVAPAATALKAPPLGPHGRLIASPAQGASHVKLAPIESAILGGAIEVKNAGDAPLTLGRIGFVVGDAGAPRSPVGASATLAKGQSPKLAPGESRTIEVRWRSDATRAADFVGYVEIASDSAAPGATAFDAPAMVGVTGDRRGGFAGFLASALVLLPLLVVLWAAIAGPIRSLGERTLTRGATLLLGLHAVLAFIATAWVDRRISGADGNDGYQLIEHARPFGIPWSLGIDGAAVPLLVSTTLVILAAAGAGRRVQLGARPFFAGLGLLSTSTVGALLSLDGRLAIVFVALGAPAAFFLIDSAGGQRARRAAIGPAAAILASAVILDAILSGLAHAAGPSLDIVSGRTEVTWSIAELSRFTWTSAVPHIVGMSAPRAAWVLAIAAFAVRAGLAPMSALVARPLSVAHPAAAAALIGTALAPLGLWVVRLGFGPGASASPNVAHWLIPLGLGWAAVGAVQAYRARDLVVVAARTVEVSAGLALACLGSRTAQGIEGALAILAWHGLAAALIAIVAGSLRDRVGTSGSPELSGLAREMPRASGLAGLALLAAAGLPGLAGFWGPLLGVAGLAARAPYVAIAASLVLLIQAIALARAHRSIFGGTLDLAWRKRKELEPFGGRFPDLRVRELVPIAPLVIALVALGLHPRLLLGATESKTLELHRRVDPAGPTQVASREIVAQLPTG